MEGTEKRVSVSKARREWAAVLRRVQAGERIILHHHGADVAVLVPLLDGETLRELDLAEELGALRSSNTAGKRLRALVRRWSASGGRSGGGSRG